MIGDRRSGRRCGHGTNVSAALLAVEFALEQGGGEPLRVITCNAYATQGMPKLGNQYHSLCSRIQAKLGRSVVEFKRKRDDVRFDVVNGFARTVLDSGDPIWVPDWEETKEAVAQQIELSAEQKIESPAESPVYAALREHFPNPTIYQPDKKDRPTWVVPAFAGRDGILIPQLKIGQYRADFGVVGKLRRVVVEVDGYTWHSSREAFANDRRRDREVLMSGWFVMRFPASEALYESAACAQQVVEFLQSELG
jgi:hypothetical protein